jgi:hypothetical protein
MFDTVLEYIVNADMYYRLWMVGELQNPTPVNSSVIKQKFTQPRNEWFPDLVDQFEDVRLVPSLIRNTGGVHHLDGDMRFHIGNRKPSIISNKMEMIWGDADCFPAMSSEERTEFLGIRADYVPPEKPMRAVGPAHITLNGLKMWHHQDTTHRRRGDAIICEQATFQWNTKVNSMGAFRESGPFQVVIKGFRAAYDKGVTVDASFDSINVSWGTENGIRLGESKVSMVIDENNIVVNYLLTDSVFGDEGEEFIFWDEVGRAQG